MVDGLIEPTRHENLEAAVDALRALLAELPLTPSDADALDLFLSDPERAADYIRRDGRLAIEFAAAGATFTAAISPGRSADQT